MAASPIIKRVHSYKFELIDFFTIYSHLPVMAKGGKAIIDGVNQMDNTVVVRLVNDPRNVFTTDARDVRLMLRKIDYIRSKDLKIIANLALDEEGFQGSIYRTGSRITMENESNTKVIIDLKGDNLAISVSKKNVIAETKNISFITAYLIKNGYDMFGLVSRSFAISVG